MSLNSNMAKIVIQLLIAILVPSMGLAVPTEQEVEIAQQLLMKLKSSDKTEASDAALKLQSYKYKEVSQSLIKVAIRELDATKPNTFVLGNAIKSMVVLSTPQDVAQLQQIKIKIDQLVALGTANKSLPYIAAELDHAINNAALRADSENVSLSQLTTKETTVVQNGKTVNKVFLKQKLTEYINGSNGADVEEAAKTVLLATSNFLSDEILEQLNKNEKFEIFGRDKETQQAIDTLTREKGKNPVLVGPRGAGKTTIAQKIAQTILEGKLPEHPVFQEVLGDAFIIETTPARISRNAKSNDNNSQADSLEEYFEAILTLEKKMGLKIVLFVDEIHTFGPGQIEAMKTYLDSRTKGIKLIGASTSTEYQNAFKDNPAIQRRFDLIGVAEQSADEVKKIIMKSEVPRAEKRYGFEISSDVVDIIIQQANRVYPDTSLVDASAKMLMTLCSSQARQVEAQNLGKSIELTEKNIYDFVQQKLGYPVNPLDVPEMKKYKDGLLQSLKQDVIGQERMVNDTVGEWMKILKNNKKGVRTLVMLGPTGVGKSLLGREFAKKTAGSEGAFLEVDANKFKEGGYSNNLFFGAPNGVGNGKSAGMLLDYLDDPGKGKFGGVIVINEAERAHTDFWEKMMELMDTGKITGPDGKERVLSRHLIILTSNRGDVSLYPKTIEDWTDSEYKTHMATLTEERLKSVFQEATNGKDQFKLPDPILARIDKYTAAEPMLPSKVQLVATQKAKKLIKQIEETFKIQIELDPEVVKEITKVSYQKGLGARPVEKKISDLLESAIDQYLAEVKTTRGDHLRVTLAKDEKESQIKVNGQSGATAFTIPKPIKHDLLNDTEFLTRLADLDQDLKKRIFGQDEMINRIKDAVIAHQATQGKRPLSFFTVGTTGTGKTEMAKALARVLYKSEERSLILDMGKIIYEGEFNNIFGAPAGHVGSTDEMLFEQFLRQNPQGGVIVFDEISNMGGKDAAQKEALFKKLYSIFEEGTWTSNATKKVYDLSKYTIINTGNDLEKLLQGVSADDIRLSIWSENKGTGNIRELLRKAGVPEAFLGRMADIILMKPLLKAEVDKIAAKIIEEQIKPYKEQGLEIHIEKSFTQDIANKFFSQNQGARSVRNLVEHRMKSAIAQLVIHAKGIHNLQGKTIYLLLEDNQKQRTYIKASDQERKVLLKATLDPKDPAALSVYVDGTEFATKINLQSKKELFKTAYHEAGHAIVNDLRLTGEEVALITVIGQDDYLGYARYEKVRGMRQSPNEQVVIAHLARHLAGQMAEKLAGLGTSAGWEGDLEKARLLAARFILEWGLGENMAAIQLDERGRPKLTGPKAAQFQKEMDRLFAAAETLAETVLREKWNLVRSVVGELYAKGEIRGDRLIEIESQLKLSPGMSKWMKSENSDKIIRKKVMMCKQLF